MRCREVESRVWLVPLPDLSHSAHVIALACDTRAPLSGASGLTAITSD